MNNDFIASILVSVVLWVVVGGSVYWFLSSVPDAVGFLAGAFIFRLGVDVWQLTKQIFTA